MSKMKQLILCRSLPGGGKSTLAKKLSEKLHVSNTYSTDDYWVRPDGIYDFNYELLGKSHAWNQARVKYNMEDYKYEENHLMGPYYDNFIIVDNSNITFNEMRPYIELALENDYEIRFVEPDTPWKYDVEECFKRNTHGVPLETMCNMWKRWEKHEIVIKKLAEIMKNIKNGV